MNAETTQVTTPSDREIEIKRSFAATRDLVYRAYTDPELVRQWLLGPEGWTMPVCEVDPRVGGGYRYEWARDDETMGLSGTFTEVDPPDRLVSRELFDDDWTGGETTVTVLFTEEAGRTTLTMTVLYASTEARDAALQTGMTEGMEVGFQRLDSVLTALR